MKKTIQKFGLLISLGVVLSCSMELAPVSSTQQEMVRILAAVRVKNYDAANIFYPDSKLHIVDSVLRSQVASEGQIRFAKYMKANILLETGKEKAAIKILEDLMSHRAPYDPPRMRKDLAIAYLRLGERSNCISNHAAESCILPIKGLGVHEDENGSRKAIAMYEAILAADPKDLESQWLMNLAYMTLGEYPDKVPFKFLIPGMEGDNTQNVVPFEDIAGDLKLQLNNMAGGSITDDFDNDGYLDIITSSWGLEEPMHYFHNNKDGTFTDLANPSGLRHITGGLNIIQADYNNDGHKDIFVLRGAWKRKFGNEPNSLIRNNGDGTFTDVTIESGLLSFHPTQAATWNDFNNDGWVDLFIGNETASKVLDPEIATEYEEKHPCELYLNNQDGTFREVAAEAQVDFLYYVKGVGSGDYNNDGWVDLYLSTMDGKQTLLKNLGMKGKDIQFEDVSKAAGVRNEFTSTFPTWFWDYDNDGWLDIFSCDYSFQKSLAHYAAAEKLNIPAGSAQKMFLFRNNHDGTFTNVGDKVGLTVNVFAMGANFGDIDNDGYLDMYLGTGNPKLTSVIPNKMFRNNGGKTFSDVTTSARVGHLQKGHGVSFADMDNDGDQDIYIEMGGALPGDAYQNSFFMNPGQNNNNWINLQVEGVASNRSGIGSRIKVTFRENGISRSVYRDVNTGGSFGASTLRREIGIGQSQLIDELEIRWQGSGRVQTFRNIKPNQFLYLKEGSDELVKNDLMKIDWILPDRLCLPGTLNASAKGKK